MPNPCLEVIRLLSLPGEFTHRPFARPALVEHLAITQPAILHDAPYLFGVSDVVKRITLNYHTIGQLAGLDCTEVAVETDRRLHPANTNGDNPLMSELTSAHLGTDFLVPAAF